MILPELSDTELRMRALHLYYPPEDRMLWVPAIDVITMRALGAIFELTPSEERLVRDKARRLEMTLIEIGQ